MLRINIILCLLLILFSCSKNETEVKLCKTAVDLEGLQLLMDLESHKEISKIPFKSKVDVVDKKKYYFMNDKSLEYSKVKYKEKIGYVRSVFLSDKDDEPFVDDVKYDLHIAEFDYDRNSAIKTFKKFMHNDGYYNFKNMISYYYIDDPQIFSLYGTDCGSREVKLIAILLNSKVASYYNHIIYFEIKNNKFVFYRNSPVRVEDKEDIEINIDIVRNPHECSP